MVAVMIVTLVLILGIVLVVRMLITRSDGRNGYRQVSTPTMLTETLMMRHMMTVVG